MAMSSEWLHFYDQQNFPPQQPAAADHQQQQLHHHLPSSVSEATAVTTTTTELLVGSGSGSQLLSPEGRVSKPIRRRTRASRRTPTTLLNTDTTNFRAMVQQFTGAPFASSSAQSGFPNMGFGFGSRPGHVNPNGLMLAPSAFHLQQQQQQQQYMYNREGGGEMMNNNTFVQRVPPNEVFMGHGDGGGFFPTTTTTTSSSPPP